MNHILGSPQPDHLFIEESVLRILNQVTINNYRQRGVTPLRTKDSPEQEIVEAIQKVLVTCFEQTLSLELIATKLNYSPFYLCRIFRKHTGRTIHQYLTQLRLRTSLEHVTQAQTDLSSLALQVGFANHSHFTETFRKAFGVPPSKLRNASRQQMRQFLSKISIA